MKIKKLEWQKREDHWFAYTEIGIFRAWPDGDYQSFGLVTFSRKRTLASAKAACQADFERRVRGCVEVEQ